MHCSSPFVSRSIHFEFEFYAFEEFFFSPVVLCLVHLIQDPDDNMQFFQLRRLCVVFIIAAVCLHGAHSNRNKKKQQTLPITTDERHTHARIMLEKMSKILLENCIGNLCSICMVYCFWIPSKSHLWNGRTKWIRFINQKPKFDIRLNSEKSENSSEKQGCWIFLDC